MGLSVSEVARIFEVNNETVRRWIREGSLKARKDKKGNKQSVYYEDLVAFTKLDKYSCYSSNLDSWLVEYDSIQADPERRIENLPLEKLVNIISNNRVEIYKIEKEIEALKQKCDELQKEIKLCEIEVSKWDDKVTRLIYGDDI